MVTPSIFKPPQLLSSSSGRELFDAVNASLEAGETLILIDMNATAYMDSGGLGYLVTLLKRVKELNRELYLCSVRGQTAMLFETTHTDQAFVIYTNQEVFHQAMLAKET